MSAKWVALELAGIRGIRLEPGTDLRSVLESIELDSYAGASILSCVGSLKETRLRLAGASDIWVSTQKVEIVSLVGTISHDGVHLHLSVSLPTGEVIGGHLLAGTIVRTTAEIMVALMTGPRLVRSLDSTTGYRELDFETEENLS